MTKSTIPSSIVELRIKKISNAKIALKWKNVTKREPNHQVFK